MLIRIFRWIPTCMLFILSSSVFGQQIAYDYEKVNDEELSVSMTVRVGVEGEKPVSVEYALTNFSPEPKELTVPVNKDEFAKTIDIRHMDYYLRESWWRNQILEHGFHAGQLTETTRVLSPGDTLYWRFSVEELVNDIEEYNALDSYTRLRISLFLPFGFLNGEGTIERRTMAVRWVSR